MSRALGRYEILRPLARGGMAEVFLARRRVAGAEKRLVIKRIRPERAADPRFLDLFVREARLSMALAHQNIVPVFDFGRVGDDLFLAMEEVEGHDLGATLARLAGHGGATVDPALAAFVTAECAAALDYAHRRRGPDGDALLVVHRDVSPRNILVSWAGEVKLVDFGVAALAGDIDASVRGTPAYMAPEQARAEAVDGRSDVYALGVVLWELLAGRRARTATDTAGLIAEARAGAIGPVDGAPAALAAVLARATAAAPADRYATAEQMHDDLDAFVAAERARRPELGSPRRRLAEWLAQTWAGEPRISSMVEGDAAPIDGKMITFVDDGPEEVLGRTHRSIAETIGTDAGGAGAKPDAAAAPPEDAPAATAGRAEPAPIADADDLSALAAPRDSSRRRPSWLAAGLLGGVAAAAAAVIVLVVTRRSNEGAAALTSGPSTAQPVAPTAPRAPEPIAQAPTPPTPPAPTPELRHAAAAIAKHPRTAVSAGSGSAITTSAAGGAAATTLAPRAVTIGATPWADFTIDDDPARHETPETVHLSPGRHVIHFDNPTLHILRTTPIDVPPDHDVGYVEHMDR